MKRLTCALFLVVLSSRLPAQGADSSAQLQRGVEQLRSTVGKWNVVTEFLKPDGSVARAATGTYEFSWIVPDRVLSGRSDIPELKQTAGIRFYVNETRGVIEMVSVARDGRLWIMTGPLGEEQRHTQEYESAGGGTGQLRFTRYNVTDATFESRMEYTEDGGKSWKPGNHQMFRRAVSGAGPALGGA
ncbi:MAG: hypothetical protein ABIZ91_00255 [Gemmatimonadaceae bacterium]